MMLFGVHSYYRVEIEELIRHDLNKTESVYVSQFEGWAWDKATWDVYAKDEANGL